MRVLLDTDITLDLVLARAPFVDDAQKLADAHQQGRFIAYIAPITPINVFYIVRKTRGADVARQASATLVSQFQVCPLDLAVLQSALALPLKDFEDAVQHAAAQANRLDAIITRNLADYGGASLPIFTPADFLQQLGIP